MVLAEVRADGVTGIGYSYVDRSAAMAIASLLAPAVVGGDAFSIPASRAAMLRAIRNHGRAGVIACAVSAVDVALWDLKAKLLGVALADLLGAAREAVPVYASGGFTSSGPERLARELDGYRAAGHRRVKIKIGRSPANDIERVRRRARSRRSRRRVDGRRQRRLRAQAGAGAGRGVRGVRRFLLRRAGVVRRSRGAPPAFATGRHPG